MLTGKGITSGLAHEGGVPIGRHTCPLKSHPLNVVATGGVVGAVGVVVVVVGAVGVVDVGAVGAVELLLPPHPARTKASDIAVAAGLRPIIR